MANSDHVNLADFMAGVARRNPGQTEFIQAVQEVAEDIYDFMEDKEDYHREQILRRIAEPDRVVSFRVCWEDDNGNIRVQRGWRVQNNNAIGPYKGGIRFHPSVTESILKFLAFEQTFKNSLTGLPIGGGKGGWVMALAQHVPSLHLHVMDLPPVAALAAQRMEQAGLSGRVTVHAGSFISNALPAGADLVTLVRVAHDHPDAVVKALLQKIYQTLPSGGRLLLAEPMAQPAGEPPVGDAYFHFYLLAMGSGRLRTPAELRGFMLEAGFESVEPIANPMPLHTRMLLAQKR